MNEIIFFGLILGCCLEYLPGIIGPDLKFIRVFSNTRLTHYPAIYERFLRLHYDYWSENVVRLVSMCSCAGYYTWNGYAMHTIQF